MVLDVLDAYQLSGDDAIDAVRALRATLHGFITLEQAGGFGLPVDVDRSFDRLIGGLAEILATWQVQASGGGKADQEISAAHPPRPAQGPGAGHR